ncbi:hypothetical protein ACVIN2_006692 [Bradyrhizobium sp. USDA 3650]
MSTADSNCRRRPLGGRNASANQGVSSCSPGERSDTRDRCESPGCRFAHPGYKTCRRAKHPPARQPLPTNIFHFTEIRFWRMCGPPRLILEGRSCGRHVREPGLRWTRQRSGARSRAGRIALREPKASFRRAALLGFVSSVSFRLRRQGWEYCGEMASRAYGKTVWSWPSLLRSSSCGCGIGVNRRGVGDFCEGEGGQRELGSRESTA